MTSGHASLRALEKRLGFEFNNPELLRRALVHASVLNEDSERADLDSNERLEFLGDAVLGHVVAAWLFEAMPDASEGQLTRARSMLVSRGTLAEVARSLDIGSVLQLGRGEEAAGGGTRDSNLADALEAVIGAVYLDRGEPEAGRVIRELLRPRLSQAVDERSTSDAKSRLQEIVQARHKETPSYAAVNERGPSHDRQFTVEVSVLDEVAGSGSGSSKRAAEQLAAKAALERIDVTGVDD